MRSFTPTLKGLITGVAMVIISFLIFYTKKNFDNSLQYITYTVYMAGIIWAVVDFSRSAPADAKFGAYFSTGFKCFIVVTLLMVVFTFSFLMMHPELKTEMETNVRATLLQQGNKTPREIEDSIAMAKKSFVPALVMAAVFSYLAIGALITAITSAVLLQVRSNSES